MGYPVDLLELYSLKIGIENNCDQVFYFIFSGRKVAGFKFLQTLSLVAGLFNNND